MSMEGMNGIGIEKAIELAIQKFKEEYGEDANLNDGEQFVTLFNNCTLVISFEDGNLKTEFVGGKPYVVDATLAVYEEEEDELLV